MNGSETEPDDGDDSTKISGLEALITAQAGKGFPPVDQWDPPYCGDIGMKIGSDGQWSYGGSPIGRAELVRLFASVLRRDEDGRHYLVTPVEKIVIEVADAPFLAVELEVQGRGKSQVLVFRTNVNDIVKCGRDHPLRFKVETVSGGLKPYLLVRGRLEALVSRALYYDLVDMAVIEKQQGQDLFGIWSDGEFFAMSTTAMSAPASANDEL